MVKVTYGQGNSADRNETGTVSSIIGNESLSTFLGYDADNVVARINGAQVSLDHQITESMGDVEIVLEYRTGEKA